MPYRYRSAAEHPKHMGCVVPPQIAEQLRAIAEQRQVPLSTVLREALVKSLERRDSDLNPTER